MSDIEIRPGQYVVTENGIRGGGYYTYLVLAVTKSTIKYRGESWQGQPGAERRMAKSNVIYAGTEPHAKAMRDKLQAAYRVYNAEKDAARDRWRAARAKILADPTLT